MQIECPSCTDEYHCTDSCRVCVGNKLHQENKHCYDHHCTIYNVKHNKDCAPAGSSIEPIPEDPPHLVADLAATYNSQAGGVRARAGKKTAPAGRS